MPTLPLFQVSPFSTHFGRRNSGRRKCLPSIRQDFPAGTAQLMSGHAGTGAIWPGWEVCCLVCYRMKTEVVSVKDAAISKEFKDVYTLRFYKLRATVGPWKFAFEFLEVVL